MCKIAILQFCATFNCWNVRLSRFPSPWIKGSPKTKDCYISYARGGVGQGVFGLTTENHSIASSNTSYILMYICTTTLMYNNTDVRQHFRWWVSWSALLCLDNIMVSANTALETALYNILSCSSYKVRLWAPPFPQTGSGSSSSTWIRGLTTAPLWHRSAAQGPMGGQRGAGVLLLGWKIESKWGRAWKPSEPPTSSYWTHLQHIVILQS